MFHYIYIGLYVLLFRIFMYLSGQYKVKDTIFFTLVKTRGWHSNDPAQSCKDIRDFGSSKGDGEYWIDPGQSKKPLKVYCDMTTDGGEVFEIFPIELMKAFCWTLQKF